MVENKNDDANIKGYEFDSTLDYYKSRGENFIIGIIDKNTNILASSEIDLFKIRPKMTVSSLKKRGTGITTFKGAVCSTKDKDYLSNIIKKINKENDINKIKENIDKFTKEQLCLEVKNLLLYLEKKLKIIIAHTKAKKNISKKYLNIL